MSQVIARRAESNAGDDLEASAEEARQEVKEGAEDVRDAARNLGDYTYAQRDDFRSEVRRHAAEIDAEIEELGRR